MVACSCNSSAGEAGVGNALGCHRQPAELKIVEPHDLVRDFASKKVDGP